jgi:hypothetical protein
MDPQPRLLRRENQEDRSAKIGKRSSVNHRAKVNKFAGREGGPCPRPKVKCHSIENHRSTSTASKVGLSASRAGRQPRLSNRFAVVWHSTLRREQGPPSRPANLLRLSGRLNVELRWNWSGPKAVVRALLTVNTRGNVRPMARALQSFAAYTQSIYGVY